MPRPRALWLLAVVAWGCGRSPEAEPPAAAAPEVRVVPAALAPDAPAPDTVDARPPLPDGFVRLRDVAPSVAQEIRYATAYNFVGEPIDAYLAPECVLTEPAARALAGVARSLQAEGLGLKVYDCYRPQTAVGHFARWTGVDDQSMKEAFYPDESKGRLFARGYIATRSGHSRGSTVDLTLVRLPAQDAVRTSFPDPSDGPLPRCTAPVGERLDERDLDMGTAYDCLSPLRPRRRAGARAPHAVRTSFPDPADGPLPRCTAPVGERLDERDLDMGTAYDCLSPLAATDSRAVPARARRNRDRLRRAMSEGGFRNYAKEWWHFTLRDEPYRTYFDFPVE